MRSQGNLVLSRVHPRVKSSTISDRNVALLSHTLHTRMVHSLLKACLKDTDKSQRLTATKTRSLCFSSKKESNKVVSESTCLASYLLNLKTKSSNTTLWRLTNPIQSKSSTQSGKKPALFGKKAPLKTSSDSLFSN